MKTQYLGNMSFDISETIRDYEFTLRAVANLNRITTSRDFEEMDSDTIFRYLKDQMEVVSFGDFLKRYIYEKSEDTRPFRDVPEEYYASYIYESFAMNRAPHAFSPVRTRWSTIIRRWLHCESVRRSTVFVLGFGLNMTDQDVSMFLTKVIKEQDFRFSDPAETIYWYCYHTGLPYSEAVSLLDEYEKGDFAEKVAFSMTVAPGFWKTVKGSLPVYLTSRNRLLQYLAWLKTAPQNPQGAAWDEFEKVYAQAVEASRKSLQEEGRPQNRDNPVTGASDIEKVLLSGTPQTKDFNLIPVTKSVLSAQFEKKRLSRQRLSQLLRKEKEVDRFDLLTLLFLVYAVNVETNWPAERFIEFIDEANAMLKRCGMMEIYPVNPYESFILMCLLTEAPLPVYNDVWEMSYKEEEQEL